MWAALGWAAWLALAVPQEPPERAEPLLPLAERQKLRNLASDFARGGERELLPRLQEVLLALGDDAQDLALLSEGWERSLAGAKTSGASRTALASKLKRISAPLVARLEREPEPRRTALARALLVLDSAEASVRTTLGYVQGSDGAWFTPEEARWDEGARAIEARLRSAQALDFDFERGGSQNPVLQSAAGEGQFVRAGGVVLHSTLDPERLERILRQALRAADLSRALASESEPPARPRERQFVLFSTHEHFRQALSEAVAQRRLGQQDLEDTLRLGLYSYFDNRGFEVVRWLDEASLSAVILWRLQEDWIRRDAQPCLRVGHLNWACLRILGTSLPTMAWWEGAAGGKDERSSSARVDGFQGAFLWRAARRTLWGCRAWMAREARAGRDPPWVRAMLDQDGKIRDEVLLKTTLVCELLQQEGRLAELLGATKGAREPIPAFERALGGSLPDLEARWQRWLLPERTQGVLQALEAAPTAAATPGAADDPLRVLNQARANALMGQMPEVPIVALEPELMRATELHARYLSANPAQKLLWPGAHEEYVDAPGYTPEGALAAGRSLVSLDGDPVRAIEGWLGTFYHRLPLLHPGLFGVGFGQSEEVVVLDAGSLVLAPWKDHVVLWPREGEEGVPRAFVPENPSPVPGADLATLGQPVSVQLFFVKQEDEVELVLELFVGDLGGAPVEAFLITPQAPLQPEFVPPNAWGLVPKRWLEPRTRYTARARAAGLERVWSFTTAK